MHSITRCLAGLEACRCSQDEWVEIVQPYLRSDGTAYTHRYLAHRADVLAETERFKADVHRRVARFGEKPLDIDNASLLDLLIGGYYAAIVLRIDTWFERTNADLSHYLLDLADVLRTAIAEGRSK